MGYRLFAGWRRLDGFEFHVIIALAGCTGALYSGISPWWVGGGNAVAWAALEAFQGVRDGKGANPFSGRWGWRKRIEGLAPIVTGAALAAAWGTFT